MTASPSAAAVKFVVAVSMTLTAVTLGAVLMQVRQQDRAAGHELRQTAEQLAAVVGNAIYVSPDLFEPKTLAAIIGRLSTRADSISRISVANAGGVVVADFDRSRIGLRSDYATARRALASGEIETIATTRGNRFSLGGADAHLELSKRLVAPFDLELDSNPLGVITIEADGRVWLGAVDFKLIGMIAAILAAGFLFTATLLRALRRTLDEASADLVEARDRAEAANAAKSEFLANMSHEIRTPINGVLGMAELLERTPLSEDQRRYVETILGSGHALLDVINHVLDFSRIEARQVELRAQPFRLSDLADEPARLLGHMAATKRLELMARIAPGLPSHALGDFARLRQVVINLAANAIKFTEAGSVAIEISGARDDAGRIALRVEVRDTGVGIPADRLDQVFEKFSQIDNAPTRVHEGTGLGLSISKGLVELMGGEIGADSTPGEGSVFWFTVALPPAPAEAEPEAEAERLRGRRALVIDADPAGRGAVADLLRSWGIEADEAESGDAALDLLAAAQAECAGYDLAILDRDLPGAGGETGAARVRSAAEFHEARVILLAAVASCGGLRRGADAVLPKPAQAAQLRAAVIAALAGDAGAEGGAAADDPLAGPDAAPIRALIAEDNEVNAFVAGQTLRSLGVPHERAKDGIEAVEQFLATSPDIVLMDVSMPRLNGYDAARRIRALEAERGLAPTPIIGLTAHALQGDREKCLEAGMSDYLAKPFGIEALRATLSQHIGAARRRGPADTAAA